MNYHEPKRYFGEVNNDENEEYEKKLQLRVHALWKRLKTATQLVILFRSRVSHSTARIGKGAPSSFFFSKQSAQLASAAAAAMLANRPTASTSQVKAWFEQKLQLFEHIMRKPIQNRSDVDIKLIAEFIRHSKFFHNFTSASIDALARALRFQTHYEGEILFQQGNAIQPTCGRCIVIRGSLLLYKNSQYTEDAEEGQDYVDWFGSDTSAGETVKFGECIDTCSSGDICGDDAISGNLFREYTAIAQVETLVAYVTQADYKHIVRFYIDNENQLLRDVRHIYSSAKSHRPDFFLSLVNEGSTTGPNYHTQPSNNSIILQTKTMLRFLSRYRCFRRLPRQFCVEILSKLQFMTVKSEDVVCHAADDQVRMFMILEGTLCVHVENTSEDKRLRHIETSRYTSMDPRRGKDRCHPQEPHRDGFLAGCEVKGLASSIMGGSLHVCSLTPGDAFGEVAITNAELVQGAQIYHPTTDENAQNACTLLSITRHDYEWIMKRYRDSIEPTFEDIHSILFNTLPHDRTDEQVHLIESYLLDVSSARHFFRQLPSFLLNMMVFHGRLESYAINEDEMSEFVQREDEIVTSMRIVLNGSIGVFKNNPRYSPNSISEEEISIHELAQPVAPKRATLRRYESRLIRANTGITLVPNPNTNPAPKTNITHSNRRRSISSVRTPVPPNATIVRSEFAEDESYASVEPVSILPTGAAFGQLQIFTQSKSPYSYAAYASGPPSIGNDNDGSQPTYTLNVYILSIPAHIVSIYLALIDEHLVYNPIKVFKRFLHASEQAQKNGSQSLEHIVRSLNVGKSFVHHTIFRGVPRSVVWKFLEGIRVVNVPAQRILFENGEISEGMLFIVLSGTVRLFNYNFKSQSILGSTSQGDEQTMRISQENTHSSKSHLQGRNSTLPGSISFDRVAGDSVYFGDYDRTAEFVMGDCLGRHGMIGIQPPYTKSHGADTSMYRCVTYPLYHDTAVTMTNCLIGVIQRRAFDCPLSVEDRKSLLRSMKSREEDTAMSCSNRDGFGGMMIPFEILRLLNLSHRLTTTQRVEVAKSLKYCCIQPGVTVFKEGEESQAMYVILFGRVTLLRRSPHESVKTPVSGLSEKNEMIVKLTEGDVFGEEAFIDEFGSTRLCTAIASGDDVATELVYLTRRDYDKILDDNTTPSVNMGMLGLSNPTFSARDRWKMAIYQVIQKRTSRNKWNSVLINARQHRIELVFDIIKSLSILEDVPPHQVKNLCVNAVLQTCNQDTVVYIRGDKNMNMCCLVLHGSVTLYQTHGGNTNALMASPLGADTVTSIRVPINVVEAGHVFGEYEMLEASDKRHINAVVAQNGTKILLIPQDEFLLYWPGKSRMVEKLTILKNQIGTLCRLDSDQLCSLYYSMQEQAFRRNDVLSGNESQAGYFHVITEGMCVVHDSVTLKEKLQSRLPKKKHHSLKMDFQVSMLGPGAIIFSEKTPHGPDVIIDSSASVGQIRPNQYIVADTPVVRTLSTQLFPRRNRELVGLVLLGKGGLDAIREIILQQQEWRAGNVRHVGRLLADTLTQQQHQSSEKHGNSTSPENKEYHQRTFATKRPDVVQILQRRDLGDPADEASPSSSLPDVVQTSTTTLSTHRTILNPLSPTKQNVNAGLSGVTPTLRLPLVSEAAVTATLVHPIVPMPPNTPRYPKVDAIESAIEQVRKEEKVLAAFSRKNPLLPSQRASAAQEKQLRLRHGRPPLKHVRNSGKFSDECSFSSVASLHDEHELVKLGLCSQLQPAKGNR